MFWGVDESNVDRLSSVYFYMCLFFIFPALYMVQRAGLQRSLYFASALNFVGALIRYVMVHDYTWVYIGTLCCATSSAFSMSLPPFLSAEWFGNSERATATTIGVLADQLGIAAGLGATVFFNVTDESIVKYTLVQCILSGVAMLMMFVFVTKDCPRTPPSAAAAAKREAALLRLQGLLQCSGNVANCASISDFNLDSIVDMMDLDALDSYEDYQDFGKYEEMQGTNEQTPPSEGVSAESETRLLEAYKETIVSLLSDKSVVLFAIVYGLCGGVFDAICTFLSQYLPYDPTECGYIGILFVMIGFIGSFLVAFVMDTFSSRYWMATFCTALGCAASMIFLWLVVWLAVDSRLLLYSAISLNGIFLSALISAGFEYGAAITYPSDENIVSGVLNCFSHVIALILVESKEAVAPGKDFLNTMLCLAFCLLLPASYFILVSKVNQNVHLKRGTWKRNFS